MSAMLPAKRGGDWDGERPEWSRPAFRAGNQVARRSSFYAVALASSERGEIQEIADVIRFLSPLEGDAQEPLVQLLSAQVWRQRQAVAYIERVGIEEAAPSLLRNLSALEGSILRGLKALALTPQAAADLGLTWAKTSAIDERDFDPGLLSEAEHRQLRAAERQLRRLLDKARASDG